MTNTRGEVLLDDAGQVHAHDPNGVPCCPPCESVGPGACRNRNIIATFSGVVVPVGSCCPRGGPEGEFQVFSQRVLSSSSVNVAIAVPPRTFSGDGWCLYDSTFGNGQVRDYFLPGCTGSFQLYPLAYLVSIRISRHFWSFNDQCVIEVGLDSLGGLVRVFRGFWCSYDPILDLENGISVPNLIGSCGGTTAGSPCGGPAHPGMHLGGDGQVTLQYA